jgi:hypothetical protein
MIQDDAIGYLKDAIKLTNDLIFNNNIFILVIIHKLCQLILIHTNYHQL